MNHATVARGQQRYIEWDFFSGLRVRRSQCEKVNEDILRLIVIGSHHVPKHSIS